MTLVFCIILPTLLLVSYISKSEFERERFHNVNFLITRTSDISSYIHDFLQLHMKGVIGAAHELSARKKISAAFTEPVLSFYTYQYPGFITMIATDKTGTVMGFFPLESFSGGKLKPGTISVKDRSYFTEVIQNKQTFISNVFEGRGFSNDNIIALSAPIFIDHKVEGIVEGSLNVENLKKKPQLQTNLSNSFLYVLDRENKVVISTDPRLNVRDNIAETSLKVLLEEQKHSYFRFFDASEKKDNGGDNAIAIIREEPLSHWKIILTQHENELNRSSQHIFEFTLLSGFVSIIAALILAHLFLRPTMRALAQFSKSMRQYKPGEPIQTETNSHVLIAREVNDQTAMFEHLGKRVENTLQEYLSICSSCKKIRNEKGDWVEIDAYIRAKTNTEFSHGICPSCEHKLYPDINQNP